MRYSAGDPKTFPTLDNFRTGWICRSVRSEPQVNAHTTYGVFATDREAMQWVRQMGGEWDILAISVQK